MNVRTGPDTSLDIAYDGPLFRLAGQATIAIDEFVFVTAEFAIEKGAPFSVTLEDPDGTAVAQSARTGQVTALTVGATNARAFFGTGGPYWVDSDGDGDIDDDDVPAAGGALGLALSDVEFALALMKPVVPALGAPANSLIADAKIKSLTALKARGSVELVGVDGVTASIEDLTVEINQAALLTTPTAPPVGFLAAAVNFTLLSGGGLDVQTGLDPDGTAGPLEPPSIKLDFSGSTFRAAATATLTVGDFVHVSGSIAFEKGSLITVGLVNPNGLSAGTAQVTPMLIGGTNLNVFVGDGGPYFVDSDGDGDIDGDDERQTAGAVGLVLDNVEFAMALLKPLPTPPVGPGMPTPSTRSYFALRASATEIGLVGVDGVTLEATNIIVGELLER